MPPSPSPEALEAHKRVLLPLFGALFTVRQAAAASSEVDRAVLWQAARWQGLGAFIVLMHAVLQVAVEFVRFMHAIGPGLGAFDVFVDPVLLACTALNVLSGVAEYGFVVFWGLRAAKGAELPFVAGAS
ncbi:MAG: hypothetical protein KDA24_27440 [Deltaproteobacteria bacterium]|nr:hypothetical protein [Deltaproteobacteria bacterium]